jgi:hypothetical protein
MRRFTCVVAAAILLGVAPLWGIDQQILVPLGGSIQTAIDNAPPGATIVLQAGTYSQSLTLTRPLTIRGAGWDKTIIRADVAAGRSDAEKLAFVNQLESAASPREQMRLVMQFFGKRPTIAVRGTREVTLTGIQVTGVPPADVEGMTEDSLVLLDDATVAITDCAVVGPFMNGITIANGAEATITRTLVAGIWNVGIAVHGRSGGRPGKLHLSDSDIRNCYHRCITIASDDVTIENCRISGSAWHGIRYDHVSPTIRGNHIFGNARSGIYASGQTAATITGNVFWRNEMGGVSCWFNNRDTIEGNTFVANHREALGVLGASQPRVVRNLFVDNPVAIVCSQLRGEGPAAQTLSLPVLEQNHFWNNAQNLMLGEEAQPLADGNVMADPQLRAAEHNFALPRESPAHQGGAGVADPMPLTSPWPIQPGEKQMIPDTDTRDYQQWKKPSNR